MLVIRRRAELSSKPMHIAPLKKVLAETSFTNYILTALFHDALFHIVFLALPCSRIRLMMCGVLVSATCVHGCWCMCPYDMVV